MYVNLFKLHPRVPELLPGPNSFVQKNLQLPKFCFYFPKIDKCELISLEAYLFLNYLKISEKGFKFFLTQEVSFLPKQVSGATHYQIILKDVTKLLHQHYVHFGTFQSVPFKLTKLGPRT